MIGLVTKYPLTVFGGSANQVEMKMAMRDASGCMLKGGCLVGRRDRDVTRRAILPARANQNTPRRSTFLSACRGVSREFTSVNAAPAFGNDIPLIY